jgi:DNA repair protein RecO (recombination protein O)
MNWQDEALVLSLRPFGENGAVANLFTRNHGRHGGFVPGGQGRRARPAYEPGNEVVANWRARLSEQLGNLSCEAVRSPSAELLGDPDRLAGLSAICSILETCLPEREAHPSLFEASRETLNSLGQENWLALYCVWENVLLADIGYGMDLSCCAATGRNDQLAYVSPKSGRAVSLSAGEAWKEKLLPLPGFLIGQGEADHPALLNSLRLTGFFLEKHIYAPEGKSLPAARIRLVDRLNPDYPLGKILHTR